MMNAPKSQQMHSLHEAELVSSELRHLEQQNHDTENHFSLLHRINWPPTKRIAVHESLCWKLED